MKIEEMIDAGRAAIAAADRQREQKILEDAHAEALARAKVIKYAGELMPDLAEYLSFDRWGGTNKARHHAATLILKYGDLAEIRFPVQTTGKFNFNATVYEEIEAVSLCSGAVYEVTNYRIDFDDFGDGGYTIEPRAVEYHEDLVVAMARAAEIKSNKATMEAECRSLAAELAEKREKAKDAKPAPSVWDNPAPMDDLTRALRNVIDEEIENYSRGAA